MHVLLADSPTAAGQRYLCSSTSASIPMGDVASLLATHYNPQGWKVPTGVLPDWVLKFLSIFDPKLKGVLDFLGITFYWNNAKGTQVMGGSWIPWQQSVLDMAESMIKRKIISKPAKGCF